MVTTGHTDTHAARGTLTPSLIDTLRRLVPRATTDNHLSWEQFSMDGLQRQLCIIEKDVSTVLMSEINNHCCLTAVCRRGV